MRVHLAGVMPKEKHVRGVFVSHGLFMCQRKSKNRTGSLSIDACASGRRYAKTRTLTALRIKSCMVKIEIVESLYMVSPCIRVHPAGHMPR
jgi:hypothetical protein